MAAIKLCDNLKSSQIDFHRRFTSLCHRSASTACWLRLRAFAHNSFPSRVPLRSRGKEPPASSQVLKLAYNCGLPSSSTTCVPAATRSLTSSSPLPASSSVSNPSLAPSSLSPPASPSLSSPPSLPRHRPSSSAPSSRTLIHSDKLRYSPPTSTVGCTGAPRLEKRESKPHELLADWSDDALASV